MTDDDTSGSSGTAGVLGEAPLGFGADPLAKVRWAMDQFGRMTRADAAQNAERDARIAEAARRGGLGSDWQRVQQRVDRGETTMMDVFAGRDDSPEATGLAGTSRQNMTELLKRARDHKADELDECLENLAALRVRVAGKLGDLSATADDAGPAWR